MKNKDLFIWLLIITITVIVIFNIKSCNNTIKNNKLIESLNDSINYYKDKNGILHSKISVIEVERTKDFTKLNLTNKELKELQELVKKYRNVKSATIIKTETKVIEKIVNKTILDTVSNTPIYKSNFNLKGYIWGDIVAKKDTTDIKINIKNDFNIVTYKEKGKLILDVSDKNPYSITKTQRSYINIPKQKRWGLGINAGYGISNSGLSPHIGLGVNYNILNF
jgi:hypothetical protein|nr:MAG TPA: hypothetical protein [Caudoviricetes sp.]